MFEEILEKLPEFLNTFENWFYNIEKDNTENGTLTYLYIIAVKPDLITSPPAV